MVEGEVPSRGNSLGKETERGKDLANENWKKVSVTTSRKRGGECGGKMKIQR